MKLTAITTWLKNTITILKWLPEYTRNDFRADLRAGLTVGVIEIPQVMAYAVIAGLSPVYGLYGSLIPLLIYPLLGTSRHLALGIVATDMIIIASGAAVVAEPGTERYVSIVLLLTLLTGLVHMVLSLLRMGFLVNLLSRPVIYGFMVAAPLIIGFSQLGNFLGIDVERSQHITVLIGELYKQMDAVNLISAAIGTCGIVLLITLKKIKPLFPRALLLLGAGGVAVWWFNMPGLGVDVIGTVPSGLPSFRFPEFTFSDIQLLVPTVATLVLIQLMSVISLGKTFGNKYRYPINPNKEFFALGAANFIGSFFQSPPVSGSFSRTAVNEQSGARSSISNMICAGVIGLTLLFLTPLFYYIPIPALAAIIIVATLSLINIEDLKYFFRTKPDDAYIAVFTFFCVIIIGIREGILLGIGASLFAVLYRSSRPNLAVLGHIRGSRSFRDISRNSHAKQIEELLILRLDRSLTFHNAEFIKDFIIHKSDQGDKKIRAVVLDGKSINDIDVTAIEALRSVVETLEEWDIEFHFAGLKGPIKELMMRSGFARKLGGTHFHNSPHMAAKYLLKKWDEIDKTDEKETSRLQNYLEKVD